MNRAVIIGNLTRDPELRTTRETGLSVCSFTVAVSRRAANQNGERTADFIPVVAWRGTAENCAKYLQKGSQVAVAGAIQTRSYEDDMGTRRYVTEIIADEVKFIGSKLFHLFHLRNGLNRCKNVLSFRMVLVSA